MYTLHRFFFQGRVATLMKEYQIGGHIVPQQVKMKASREQNGLLGIYLRQGI